MKQCTKCGEFKPLQYFGSKKHTLASGGVTYYKRAVCRPCTNADNLSRYHNNKKTKQAHKTASYRHRIKGYGLSLEQYLDMLESQEGRCFICRCEPNETLHIDHCHSTGKVRKLLCNNCNTALGHAKEDVEILEAMIKYVKEERH